VAKNIVRCPKCDKAVTVVNEMRLDAFGQIFVTYDCGHTVCEEIVSLPTPQSGHRLVCALHLCDVTKTNAQDHENCKWNEKDALAEIPTDRLPHFARAMYYQREGVEFLEASNFNALLADEQGLGKTIQIDLAIKHHKEKLTPTLFVVKASLRLNQANEMWNNQWICDNTDPMDAPFILLDGKSAIIPGFRYYIVPMSLLNKFKKELIAMNFRCLVVDESQAFANTNTARTKALLEIAKNIPHKLCTSGTPVLNRASEYFPTLNLIKPAHWNNFASFLRNWIEAEATASGAIKYRGIKEWKREAFFRQTAPYILRRKKRDVLKDLPKFSRHFIVIDISESEVKNAYNDESKNLQNWMNSEEYFKASGFEKAATKLGYLMRMRHLCGIAKAPICAEHVAEFLDSTDEDQKIIVGCHHDDVMQLLSMGLAPFNPIMLGGGLDNLERATRIEEFKKPGRRVCVAKILAQGEGLNLQFCSNMIVLERQWNPGKEEQFEARIDRFGQLQPTVADYFVAKNTVDEDFSAMVEDKRQICGGTLDPDFDFEMNSELLNLLAEKAATRRL
jgi:SNF2 family DNA or RNA helicase